MLWSDVIGVEVMEGVVIEVEGCVVMVGGCYRGGGDG